MSADVFLHKIWNLLLDLKLHFISLTCICQCHSQQKEEESLLYDINRTRSRFDVYRKFGKSLQSIVDNVLYNHFLIISRELNITQCRKTPHLISKCPRRKRFNNEIRVSSQFINICQSRSYFRVILKSGNFIQYLLKLREIISSTSFCVVNNNYLIFVRCVWNAREYIYIYICI